MAPFKIVTPDAQYTDDAVIERGVAGDLCSFEIHRGRAADVLPDRTWAQADGLLVWHEVKLGADLLAKLERCRVIVRAGVGYDHIDLVAAGRAGIPVCNTPDYGTSEVADHAISMMLALARGIVGYQDLLREDPVGNFDAARVGQRRIRGRTMGIVGLGRIGTAVALRAKSFGMHVIAFDPYLPSGQEIAVGVQRARSVAELLGAADVVSLHAPLTSETRHLIDDSALAAMRPDAILINTARGGMIDLDALGRGLRAGRLGAAALDVFPVEPPEPLPDLIRAWHENEAWVRGRLLLTPHAAWSSPESRDDARRLSAETLLLYLRDGTLRNCVNARELEGAKQRH
jgi:D-3-phosphoglycerate dehydrogenase